MKKGTFAHFFDAFCLDAQHWSLIAPGTYFSSEQLELHFVCKRVFEWAVAG